MKKLTDNEDFLKPYFTYKGDPFHEYHTIKHLNNVVKMLGVSLINYNRRI